MADVAGHQNEVIGQRDGGYPEVGFAEPLAGRLEPGAKWTVDLCGIFVEGEDGDGVG